jgi:hypothetical protein
MWRLFGHADHAKRHEVSRNLVRIWVADLPGADRTQAATLIPHRTQHPPIGGRRIARSLLNCTDKVDRAVREVA